MQGYISTCPAVKCDAPPPIAPTAKPIRIAGLSPGIGGPQWTEQRERYRRRMRKRRPYIKAGQELFRDRENGNAQPSTCHHKVTLGQKKKDPGTDATRTYRFFHADCGCCDDCQNVRLLKWMTSDLAVIATWDRVETLQVRTDKEREKVKKRISRAGKQSYRVARLRGGTQLFTNARVGGVVLANPAEYIERFYGTHVDATAHTVSSSYHPTAKMSPEPHIEEIPIEPLGTNGETATTDPVDRDDPAVMMAATLDAIEAKVDADPLSSGKTHTELVKLTEPPKHMALTPEGFAVCSMNPRDWVAYTGPTETPAGTPENPLPATDSLPTKPKKRVSIWEKPRAVRKGFLLIAEKYGGRARTLRMAGAYLVDVPQDKAEEFEDVAFVPTLEEPTRVACTCRSDSGLKGECLHHHPKRKTSSEHYGNTAGVAS